VKVLIGNKPFRDMNVKYIESQITRERNWCN